VRAQVPEDVVTRQVARVSGVSKAKLAELDFGRHRLAGITPRTIPNHGHPQLGANEC
jgi:hypothetical protein